MQQYDVETNNSEIIQKRPLLKAPAGQSLVVFFFQHLNAGLINPQKATWTNQRNLPGSGQMGDSAVDSRDRWYTRQHISPRRYKGDDERRRGVDGERFQGRDAWSG